MRIILFLLTLFSSFVVKAQIAPVGRISVSGVVWEEGRNSTPNGIRDAGERLVGGVLVELRTVSDNILVGSDISNVNGEFTLLTSNVGEYYVQYNFPTSGFTVTSSRIGSDNTINSAALNSGGYVKSDAITLVDNDIRMDMGIGLVPVSNTYTYFANIPKQTTNWTKSVSLPKTEALLGTLQAVELLFNTASFHPIISVSNSSQEASEIDIEVKGDIVLRRNDNSWLPSASQSISGDPLYIYEILNAGDVHYVYNYAASTSKSYGITDLTLFTGAGTFDIKNIQARGSYTVNGDTGNSTVSVETQMGAGVFVVYKFEEGSLPVDLISFRSEITTVQGAPSVNLKWSTASESNSSRFEVERSNDGSSWATIGTVYSNEESITEKQYNFDDLTASNGINYYRLKMIDLDDTFENSRIITQKIDLSLAKSYIYPNPISERIYVKSIDWKNVDRYSVLDLKGKHLIQGKGLNALEGINVAGLSKGIYILNITMKDGSFKNYKANVL